MHVGILQKIDLQVYCCSMHVDLLIFCSILARLVSAIFYDLMKVLLECFTVQWLCSMLMCLVFLVSILISASFSIDSLAQLRKQTVLFTSKIKKFSSVLRLIARKVTLELIYGNSFVFKTCCSKKSLQPAKCACI